MTTDPTKRDGPHRREGTRPTVQVLVTDDAERDAVRELLGERYTVDTSPSLQDADLYLVEERTFREYAAALQTHVETQHPQFCPVVVIRPPNSRATLPEPSETDPPVVVDDVLDAPLTPAQTFRRIDTLLSLRRQTRELQETLRALEETNRRLERYEQLVENVPLGVLRTTPEPGGEYRLVNQGAVEIFEADSKRELLETPVAATHSDPDGRQSFSSHLEDAGVIEGHELRLQTLDGDPFWGELSGIATDENGETVFDLVLRDVTERKERERRYNAIFNKTFQFTGLLDTDGTVLEANETALEFGGLDRADVIGKPFWEVEWWQIDEATRQEVQDAIDRAADGAFVRYEVEVQGAEETAIIDFSIRPITDEQDAVTELIPEGRDITERKEFEDRLKRQRDDLDFLNEIMRHDIRNDLQLISGYAKLLADHVDDDGQRYLDEILENAENAVALTSSARDLAEVMLQPTVENTSVPLESTLLDQIETARASHDTAVVHVEDPVPRTQVVANEMLSSVFRNLLNNAIQHNDKAVPEVTVSVDEHEAAVTVRVADNGPGVPDDRKESIFGKGEKAYESEGTGIGLYLVDSLVTEYGGAVWIEDNEPEGAVFVVQLQTAE